MTSGDLDKPLAPARQRVLIVDDHPMFRHGIARVLSREPDLEICAEASNFGEALNAGRRWKPDLALVDISMPGINGLELIKALRAEHPELRMLVLSMYSESLYALRAVRAGALGYLMKDESYETVVTAIRSVLDDRLFLSPSLVGTLFSFAVEHLDCDSHPDLEALSSRERQVLQLYGEGCSTREICDRFQIGLKTVETYRTRIKEKLGLENLSELLHFAAGWVQQQSLESRAGS